MLCFVQDTAGFTYAFSNGLFTLSLLRDFCASLRLFCGDTEAFMRLLLKVVFQKSPIEQVKFLALLLVGLIKCLF